MTVVALTIPIVTKLTKARSSKPATASLAWTRCDIDVEQFSTLEAPIAISWRNKNENLIRFNQRSGGYLQRLDSQPRTWPELSFVEFLEEDVCKSSELLDEFAAIAADFNGDREAPEHIDWPDPDSIPQLDPTKIDAQLLEKQIRAVHAHFVGLYLIDKEIYCDVNEPVAVVLRDEPNPVPETYPKGWEPAGIAMIYSLADWDKATALIARLRFAPLPQSMKIEVYELNRGHFSPSNPIQQKAALIRFFSHWFNKSLRYSCDGAAGILAALTEDDKKWLGVFAECCQKLEKGIYDDQFDSAAQALLSGRVSEDLLGSEGADQFRIVRDQLIIDLAEPSVNNTANVALQQRKVS